jgi:hypothetical protein
LQFFSIHSFDVFWLLASRCLKIDFRDTKTYVIDMDQYTLDNKSGGENGKTKYQIPGNLERGRTRVLAEAYTQRQDGRLVSRHYSNTG